MTESCIAWNAAGSLLRIWRSFIDPGSGISDRSRNGSGTQGGDSTDSGEGAKTRKEAYMNFGPLLFEAF